jgi:hypothetical protein
MPNKSKILVKDIIEKLKTVLKTVFILIAAGGTVCWIIGVIIYGSISCARSTIYEEPGPSNDHTCVLNRNSIRYQYSGPGYSNGEHYSTASTSIARVGDSGLVDLCTFESLTKVSDNAWEATFQNQWTGKTAKFNLSKCLDSERAKTPSDTPCVWGYETVMVKSCRTTWETVGGEQYNKKICEKTGISIGQSWNNEETLISLKEMQNDLWEVKLRNDKTKATRTFELLGCFP